MRACLSLVGFKNNSIFDLSSKLNRDNCFYPYFLLKKHFMLNGIEINTCDIYDCCNLDFDLQMDVQNIFKSKKSYLLMLETPQIHSENGIPSNILKYKKVFTWNDNLVDGDRFVKINFPNEIKINKIDGFINREIFCCLIAGNKVAEINDAKVLYLERIKVIRWFEKNAAKDFALYGVGWDIPPASFGLIGKIKRHFFNLISKFVKLKSFPSYGGRVNHKYDTLIKVKFSICYENVRDLPGYITEKIFDCFFSGCVPVYLGATNITDYIPEDCFIDRRKFGDIADVYNFLKAMTEQEFKDYQQRIANFLQSNAAQQFSAEFFAKTIVKTIVDDMGVTS